VRLERLQVSFDKNWKPNETRTGSQRLTKEDFDKIKNALADEFARTCAQELAKGGYQVVDEAGEDVLAVTPLVVDLSIAAPQKMAPGRTITYTADPGRMTLVAELRGLRHVVAVLITVRAHVLSPSRSLTGAPVHFGRVMCICHLARRYAQSKRLGVGWLG